MPAHVPAFFYVPVSAGRQRTMTDFHSNHVLATTAHPAQIFMPSSIPAIWCGLALLALAAVALVPIGEHFTRLYVAADPWQAAESGCRHAIRAPRSRDDRIRPEGNIGKISRAQKKTRVA